MIRTFPELCAPLFTYTGDLDPNEVAQAVYVDECDTAMQTEDDILLRLLKKYLQQSD